MICDTCSHIPLDLFLPLRACGHCTNGYAFNAVCQHFKGPTALKDLEASADNECHMCRLMLAALSVAEPAGAIPRPSHWGRRALATPVAGASRSERPAGVSGISLEVHAEGEVIVSDGTRESMLWWWNEKMGQGKTQPCPVNVSADDPWVFAIASSWLKTCTQSHTSCNTTKSEAFLPSRLIEIGTGNEPSLRLVDAKGGIGISDHRYFALSHCWGTSLGLPVPRTTKATLRDHQTEISWRGLSKTFQDAIIITQRLGLHYIWIDSLCIIQDEPRDFEVECGQMSLIYTQAYCTISASDSPHGDSGCFIPRDPNRIRSCTLLAQNWYQGYRPESIMSPIFGPLENTPPEAEIRVFPTFGQWSRAIQGPLSTRGWCLQERELSPRVLHYTQDRVLWECRECTATEDQPKMVLKRKTNQQVAQYLSSWRLLDNEEDVATTMAGGYPRSRLKWYAMIEEYSRRRLSVKADRLPALSGIAAEMSKRRMGDEYLVGLWKSDLFRGLSWFPKAMDKEAQPTSQLTPLERQTRFGPGIPSWSWVAFDGPIKYHGDSWFGGSWEKITNDQGEEWVKRPPKIQLRESSVKRSSLDPFGHVYSGEITLTGWAIEVSISEDHCLKDRIDHFHRKRYSLEQHAELPCSAAISFDEDVDKLPDVRVLCLQLGNGKSFKGFSTNMDNGLVLVQVSKSKYIRVGMFDVEPKDQVWTSRRAEMTVCIV